MTGIFRSGITPAFKQKMPTSIPIAAFKCLVKIAVTIMPEEDILDFKDTITWLNEEKHQSIPGLLDLEHGFGRMKLTLMDMHYSVPYKGAEIDFTINDLDGICTHEIIEES